MTSLYRRATPSQAMLLRIIAGAVKNACDAHPDIQISPQMRRSIAKRAAGTISAQWPELLAAPAREPSGRSSSKVGEGGERAALSLIGPRHPGLSPLRAGGGGRHNTRRRSPLVRIWTELSYRIGHAKRAGSPELAAGLIEAIRIVARMREEYGA